MQYIQEISEYIDDKILYDLNTIKNLFLDNYYTVFLINKPKLKNTRVILHKIENYKQTLDSKIEELKNYGNKSEN